MAISAENVARGGVRGKWARCRFRRESVLVDSNSPRLYLFAGACMQCRNRCRYLAVPAALALLLLAAAPVQGFSRRRSPRPTLWRPRLEPGLPSGMDGAFEYGDYAFAHDDVDSFYFRLSASPGPLRLRRQSSPWAGYFEIILMCGPVPPAILAANIADFWMNAVQFQYGLYASLALPLPGRPHLLAEYSRTSQHDLRPEYSAGLLSTSLSSASPRRSSAWAPSPFDPTSGEATARSSRSGRAACPAAHILASHAGGRGRAAPRAFRWSRARIRRSSSIAIRISSDADWFAEAGVALR